jgi:hypothetical protein
MFTLLVETAGVVAKTSHVHWRCRIRISVTLADNVSHVRWTDFKQMRKRGTLQHDGFWASTQATERLWYIILTSLLNV